MGNDNPRDNEKWRRNGRMTIYAMAGFYLLTLAYNMFHAISSSKGNEQLIMIIFTILFTIIGLGMIILGLSAGYRSRKKTDDSSKEDDESDESEEE